MTLQALVFGLESICHAEPVQVHTVDPQAGRSIDSAGSARLGADTIQGCEVPCSTSTCGPFLYSLYVRRALCRLERLPQPWKFSTGPSGPVQGVTGFDILAKKAATAGKLEDGCCSGHQG